MHTNDNSGAAERRPRPTLTDPGSGIARPRIPRTTLFEGWGPKLLVAAIAATAFGANAAHASAQDAPAVRAACAVPAKPAATLDAATPEFPDAAAIDGATGNVRLRIALDASGKTNEIAVDQSSGNAWLDRAAVRAAQHSTFSPEIADCRPVAGTYWYEVRFGA